MKKTTLITAVLAAAMLVSCADDPTRETAADRKVVMNIAEEKVEFQEYRYFWKNNKRDLYGEDATLTKEQLDTIAENVKDNVVERHALYLLAAKHGVEVTDEDRKLADNYVDAYRESCNDKETYRIALTDQYMTDALFREITLDTTIAYALLDAMDSDGTLDLSDEAYKSASKSDDMLCLKEIYISFPDESLRDWAKNQADLVLSKLESGEKFETLMSEYSSYDPGELPPEHGYYTMKYDALDQIWQTAIELREGQHSGVIETDFGYHIIMRAKKDTKYMEEKQDELYEIFRQSRFYEKFYEYCATLTPEFTEYGASLTDADF